MSGQGFARLVLHARLWWSHTSGFTLVAGCLFAIGTAMWLWGLPHLRAQIAMLHKAQARVPVAANSVAPTGRSLAVRRLDEFYAALGEHRHVEQQVKSLFAIARAHGLILSQGEYKSTYDRAGQFYVYKVLLPVRGPYQAIRPFCEEVLRVIPFASLDEMTFRRDAITTPGLEAKLAFTLYLTVDKAPSPSLSLDRATESGTP